MSQQIKLAATKLHIALDANKVRHTGDSNGFRIWISRRQSFFITFTSDAKLAFDGMMDNVTGDITISDNDFFEAESFLEDMDYRFFNSKY